MEENKNLTNTENTTNVENGAEAPKKKKPAIVFRPQNGSNGRSSAAGARTGAGRAAAGTRPAASTAASAAKKEGTTKPSGILKPAVEKKEAPAAKTASKKVVVASEKEEVKKVAKEETSAAVVKEKENAKPVEAVAKTENVKAETALAAKEEAPAKEDAPVKEAPTAKAPATDAENKENVAAEEKKAPEVKKSITDGNKNIMVDADGRKRLIIRDNRTFGKKEGNNGGNSRSYDSNRNGNTNGGYRRTNGTNGSSDGQNRYGDRQGQGGYQRRDNNGTGRSFDRNNNREGYNRDGFGKDGFNKDAFNKDGDNNNRGQRFGGRGQNGSNGGPKKDNLGRQISDLTPIQAKNSDNRKAKDFARKDKDKDNKYDQPKKTENTKNLNKSMKNRKASETPVVIEEKKEDEIRTLVLPDTMTIKFLAEMMKQQPSALVKALFMKGQMVTINSEISYEQAEEIALEYNCICEHEVKVDVIEELLRDIEDDPATLVSRPPVVCVMGHVDHGKTSLLDAIRKTNVTAREAGGITQHIGASVVECNGQKITFLDTPGHEAFTAMRMRGAQSTDIAILVVAADDGVMPQTVEAINHAKAAGVEIIVAVNKIDKPSANVERVKQELTEYDLVPEEWGGKTIYAPVSAKSGEGIDNLLEMVLLAADIHELKANPNRKARGIVIEAKLDKGRGPVATVLIQKGTLHVGENIAIGPCYGKIRAMIDDNGRRVKEAGPSTPVEILGLNDVPNAGDIFVCHENEREARAFAETFIKEHREKLIEETKAKLTLDGLFSMIQAGNVKELNIIIKADVQGSVEAVRNSLVKLSNEEVVVKVIHGGVGAVNESDVILASASNAIIIGFNVRPEPAAKITADREGIDMRLYSVIYQAIEDVEAAMKGMLDPIFEEKVIGHAVVRQTFKSSQAGVIAGSYVLDGVITRGCSCRVFREGEQIFEGVLTSLKRFKDDAKEVKEGFECGLSFEKFNDLKEEDTIEAYTMVEVAR